MVFLLKTGQGDFWDFLDFLNCVADIELQFVINASITENIS